MNKNYMLSIFSFIGALAFLTAGSLVSAAEVSCQPIYGGGQSCVTNNNVIVNKTVLNPQTNQFVDNLGVNDPKYKAGFIATFQISVTNSGNANIPQIDIKDVFPQYITFNLGAGNFDPNTNTLSFSVNNLAPNETRRFTILGRVFDAAQIPIDLGSSICVVNQAIATINNGNLSQDNAQLCIEKPLIPTTLQPDVTTPTKGGFPVMSPAPITTTPATGPESFALLALVPTLGVGIFLRKISSK
ncbi:MAG: hypothetical protein Q8P26_04565 [Candidatus Levybacteria bacterium]|nr:hypothetical protein [Candidatus Levybacteria bacterium]